MDGRSRKDASGEDHVEGRSPPACLRRRSYFRVPPNQHLAESHALHEPVRLDGSRAATTETNTPSVARAESSGFTPLLPDSEPSRMAAGKGLQAGLPAEVLEASYEPGALKYLTRGLTSNIYSLRLSPSDLPLSDKLRKLQASPGTIVVKAVDTEDEARPHSVLKELLILQRLSSSNQPPGHQYVSRLHVEIVLRLLAE